MSDKITCPKCSSNQLTANEKGFSSGKALTGAVLVGGVGMLAGLHGSKDVIITCLKCGYRWDVKEAAENSYEQKENESAQRVEKFNAEFSKWKASLYKAYKAKDYQNAESIYLTRNKFNITTPDIHSAFAFQKKLDRENMLVRTGIITVLFLFIGGLIKCVA